MKGVKFNLNVVFQKLNVLFVLVSYKNLFNN
jgi:hypothetical protein